MASEINYCANEMIYTNMTAGIYRYQQPFIHPFIAQKHMCLYCMEKDLTNYTVWACADAEFFLGGGGGVLSLPGEGVLMHIFSNYSM